MSDPSDTGREEAIAAFLRKHPGCSRRQVMLACGASARLVARVERSLALGASGPRGRGPRLVLLAVALGSIGTWFSLRPAGERSPQVRPPAQAARASERDLYAALDHGEVSTSALDRAWTELASEDEGARLAALRLLARHAPADPRLAGALDDASPRVRRAALQLVSTAAPGASEVHVQRAADRTAPQAERLLALAALDRGGRLGLPRARKLAALVEDPDHAVRAAVLPLLERALGRRPEVPPGATPTQLAAAWRRAMEATP